MEHIIKSHGLKFVIEGFGFFDCDTSEDFERAVEAVQAALDGLPQASAASLHADTLAWMAVECDGEPPAELSRLGKIGTAAGTAEWANKSTAFISVSAQ